MCDSSVPDTQITVHVTHWHTHAHKGKTRSVRGHERVRQASTTREGNGRKQLVDIVRQKWE